MYQIDSILEKLKQMRKDLLHNMSDSTMLEMLLSEKEWDEEYHKELKEEIKNRCKN